MMLADCSLKIHMRLGMPPRMTVAIFWACIRLLVQEVKACSLRLTFMLSTSF